MDFFLAILLGVLQGLLEFLPVSSSGHLVILERLSSYGIPALTFHVFLHAGTMAAIIITLRHDAAKIAAESFRRNSGLFSALGSILNRGGEKRPASYQKTAKTNYSRLSSMIGTAMIPTAAVGLILRRSAVQASGSLFFSGIGFLVTGIFLLVTDKVAPGSTVPRDVPLQFAWLFGLINGIAVLPGVSSTAVILCAGIFAGFNRKTAIRFTFLLSVPTVAAALLLELAAGIRGGIFTPHVLGCCLLGMLAAAVSGTLAMNTFVRLLRRSRFIHFAYYCFAAGTAAVMIGYYLP